MEQRSPSRQGRERAHICEVCGIAFTTRKATSRTCGWSCRGSLAGTTPSRQICECGAPASKRGWCPECSLQRKREAKRRWNALHHDEILAARRARYREDEAVRKRSREVSVRSRFNGHRGAVLERDGHRCTRCGATDTLVVHHRLGDGSGRRAVDRDSAMADLETLCRACHLLVHKAAGHLDAQAVIVQR